GAHFSRAEILHRLSEDAIGLNPVNIRAQILALTHEPVMEYRSREEHATARNKPGEHARHGSKVSAECRDVCGHDEGFGVARSLVGDLAQHRELAPVNAQEFQPDGAAGLGVGEPRAGYGTHIRWASTRR